MKPRSTAALVIILSSASAHAGITCHGQTPTEVGTPRADVIHGTPRADVIVGLGGNDVIRGLGGDDIICAGRGADRVFGGHGADIAYGGPGNDTIKGGLGDDTLWGDTGWDRIAGEAGSDTILGGPGDYEVLSGTDWRYNPGFSGPEIISVNWRGDIAAGDEDLCTFGPDLPTDPYSGADPVAIMCVNVHDPAYEGQPPTNRNFNPYSPHRLYQGRIEPVEAGGYGGGNEYIPSICTGGR